MGPVSGVLTCKIGKKNQNSWILARADYSQNCKSPGGFAFVGQLTDCYKTLSQIYLSEIQAILMIRD
jgi:hypothetical protein